MNTSENTPVNGLTEAIQNGSRSSKSTRITLGALGVGIVAVIAWLLLGARAQANNAGPSFRTQAIEMGEIRLTVTATGNLEPTNEVTVGSELSGTVLEVYADANDRVSKGQELVRLDTTSLENELKANKAQLASAKAALLQAQATEKEAIATLERQQELHRLSEGRIPSKAELSATEAAAERAKADVQSAEASIGQAQAQIEITESDLNKAIIRSPVDGVILTRSIEAGQTVAASFETPELFVIAEDLAQMKLEVAVAEADIGQVDGGQKATFQVDAWPDRSYDATVQKVSYGSEVTDNVVTYATELSVSNQDLSLRPGMTATADIYVAHHQDVLLVPVAALRFDLQAPGDAPAAQDQSGGGFVNKLIPHPPRRNSTRSEEESAPAQNSISKIWILKNGQPTPVEVRTGLTDGRYTEVSGEGLSEGTEVILSQNS
ncbi:efflux RND transporter periplasmic adaptor subunit [Coraliomargarita parva]|uniref:efflux RND transporter periplasmic adaptor subunit n=1 Tax=Coraliomargarita parva TaxID=3014050 RepID=UPI0022B3CE81|nr:efflux RND transporter periplasmic adaptor subunit [Coraliomargarita parva]